MRYDALRDLKCLIQDTFDQVYPEKRGVYSKEDLKSEISDSYGGVRNEVQNQLCEGSCEILRTIRTLLTCAIVWDDEELNIFNMCYNICTGIVDNADLHNPAGLSDLVLTMIDIGENIGKIQNNIMNK